MVNLSVYIISCSLGSQSATNAQDGILNITNLCNLSQGQNMNHFLQHEIYQAKAVLVNFQRKIHKTINQ